MTLHRWAKRRDANEPKIIALLKAHGYSAQRIDVPCDLIVGKGRVTHLVEIKMPGEKLTDSQEAFRKRHRGCLHVAEDGDELIEALKSCSLKARY